MTAETVDLAGLLDRDLVAGILAAADLREQRAKAAEHAAPGPWRWQHNPSAVLDGVIAAGGSQLIYAHYDSDDGIGLTPDEGEHIAAEANPGHALAAVRHWWGVVKRHTRHFVPGWDSSGDRTYCAACRGTAWPCTDLQEVAADVRAYLSGGPQ